MAVAVAGEQAEPRVPAPTLLRPVLGFARLSAASYGLIERVLDGDPEFRARVADAATEDDVGRAGWLWLHRPDGWEDEADRAADAVGPAARSGEASARLRREREGAEAAAERHRRQAEAAELARQRAEAEAATLRSTAAATEEERTLLATRVTELEDERTELVRRLKAAESDAAAARRDLRVAREATRQAEAELLARGPGRSTAAPVPVPDPRVAPARSALSEAAVVAADLARAIEVAAAALDDAGEADRPSGSRRHGTSTRRPPSLPPGLADDSPEAHRHLLSAAGALLVVDGYNLARTAWPELEPEEERRRTVALLEEHRARTGTPITVVFDGNSATVAPVASRSVRVRFSETGETADDAIAGLLADLPVAQEVVVVSSDREVADDARRQGAAALSSAAFLAALRR